MYLRPVYFVQETKNISYSSTQIKIYKFTGFKFKLYCTYAQKLNKNQNAKSFLNSIKSL